jgi:phosphate transport system protein
LVNYLISMARTVEVSVSRALGALLARGTPETEQAPGQIFLLEPRINEMEMVIDDHAVGLLRDHRLGEEEIRQVVAALKITNDLERMGDLAVNIVERALSLITQPPVKPLVDIPRMAHLAELMVRNSLDSFVKRDAELARSVLLSDDAVDDLRDTIEEDLVKFMQQDPSTISRALDLVLVARSLERIADHATNIAEDALFLIQGVDVRHHSEAQS